MLAHKYWIACIAAMFISCSFDYSGQLATKLEESVPDSVFFNFKHVVMEGVAAASVPRLKIEASRAESYSVKHEIKLYDVAFTEYDPLTLKIISEGKAATAILNTETEDAEFSGSVYIKSVRDGIFVESGYLSWNSKSKTLVSRAEAVTTIGNTDGAKLSGSGFKSDAKNRTFVFSNEAKGVYVNTKEKNDK